MYTYTGYFHRFLPVERNIIKPILLSSGKNMKPLRLGLTPPANYTDRATAACRRRFFIVEKKIF
jgi:hypothetical protein